MRQQRKQIPVQVIRTETPANDSVPPSQPRTAGLPGAERRILRKRLAGPAKAGAAGTGTVRPGTR